MANIQKEIAAMFDAGTAAGERDKWNERPLVTHREEVMTAE